MGAAIQGIKSIMAILDNIITPNTPLPPIDKMVISLGMRNRPGVSASRVANNIIARKSEAGIPPVPSEEDLRMERIRAEEIIRELQTNAKIVVVIPENAIRTTVYTFTPAGATPTGYGTNEIPYIGIAKGYVIIR